MSNFPNVDAYCEIDLDNDSEAVKVLLAKETVGREGNAKEVMLTDIIGAAPASITPHMRNWYNSQIERLRKPALDEINDALSSISADTGVGAALLERRLDQVSDNQILEKRKARIQSAQQNVGDYSILNERKRSFQEASRMYDRRRMERRREPKIMGWFYWCLIGFVGIFELFINFDAFTSLKFMTPLTATGSTVVIAMLLALASHLHGGFFKEFQFRFGDQSRPGDKGAAWRSFSLGTLAFMVVLAAVWYARANYFKDTVLEAAVIGGTPPTWLATVGGSLLQNVGVWVTGTIISFLCHDSDPEFPELRKSRDLHSKRYRKLESNLNGDIEKELRRIDAQSKDQRTDAKHLDMAMCHEEKYLEARRQFDRLSSHDARVIGLLQQYQSEFVNRATDNETNLQIVDEAEPSGKCDISPADYGAAQIKLKHL